LTGPGAPPGPPSRHRQGGWPDERHTSYQRVECDRCGTAVQAAKFSAQHTSVQWTTAAVLACAEFRARAAGGERSALVGTCASMRASIEAAVAHGHLEVSPP
jgi:hypothetical protein